MRSASSSVVPTGAVTRFFRHHLSERPIEIPLELQVAVGDDADEPPLAIDDRNARDLETGS